MIGKQYLAVLCLLAIAGQGLAQKLDHPLRASNSPYTVHRRLLAAGSPSTVRVLAVMVQFRADTDPLTTGTGQFDLTTDPQRIIDAPPRDSAYFADHLLFARNYFQKASKGSLVVTTTLLGSVLTVSKSMKEYAPVNSDLPLGALVSETWGLADSLYPAFPFDQYDLFVIFHAGVGKDLDLKASIGYDPTPYDIPSLYFGATDMQSELGLPAGGVALKNHPGFTIRNTAILPETENRPLPAATGGTFLYQLGINGLLVANIGSYLGMPDLFNTITGGTAIGRFGLMDGQSIFSFAGLFPPAPSAWERTFLGWTSPILIPSGSSNLRLPARSLNPVGDTVYRVPVSAQEYFLVENRDRDVNADGVTLTIRWNNTVFTKHFAQDDDDFNASNVDSVYGDVLDVDDIDWSLPGAQGYLGGALIWHVDEGIIAKNFATNSINADLAHRGVFLEEADGSQDIGQSYGLLDPGSGTEDGWALDYWFSKNNSPVFTNAFNETTHPNSLSNSSARSHVALDQFSDAGPVMTFHAAVGDSRISLWKTLKRKDLKSSQNDAPYFADVEGNGNPDLVFTAGDSIYVLRRDLTPVMRDSGGLYSRFGGRFQPVLARSGGVPSATAALGCARDSSFVLLSNRDLDGDGVADPVMTGNTGHPLTSPSAAVIGSAAQYFVEDQDGGISEFAGLSPAVVQRTVPGNSPLLFLSVTPSGSWTAASSDSLFNSQGATKYVGSKKIVAMGNVAFSGSSSSTPFSGVSTVTVCSDNTFSIYDAATLGFEADYPVGANVTGGFALADVNGDGQIDILVGTESGLYAFGRNGVLLDHFPLKPQDGGKVIGSPLVVRLSGSTSTAILFGSSLGQVCAYDDLGNPLDGFPLQTGGIVSSLAFSGNLLAAASTDSSVYLWKVTDLLDSTGVLWGGFLGNEFHSDYAESASPTVARSAELLPTSMAYNWPNPVFDKTTHIRYYLGMPATVTIKIFNLAGELVQQFAGPGQANLDNEVLWDVTKVQSGVYFAQIRATSSGQEKSVIVKIAVVR